MNNDVILGVSGIVSAVLTQMIKLADGQSKFKRFYGLIAVLVGTIGGYVASTALGSTPDRALTDGLAVATATFTVMGLKDLVSVKLPGDSTYEP